MTHPFPIPNPSEVVDELLVHLADDNMPSEYRPVMLAAARTITLLQRDFAELWDDFESRIGGTS